jgi:hypothetical protein
MNTPEAVIAFTRWQRDMLELQRSFIDVKRQSRLQQRFFEVGRNSAELMSEKYRNNPFPRGISMWYGYYVSASMRRFCDRNPDSRSIVTLLSEMMDSPLTCDVFDGRVTADELASDIQAILKITAKEKHFMDRAIGHSDRRGIHPEEHPTFNETHRTIDALEPFFRKYCDLLGLRAPLDPQLPPDWDSIFSFAWAASE